MAVEIGPDAADATRVCEICGGPPPAGCGTCARLLRARRLDEAVSLVRRGVPVRRAARQVGIARSTLRRALCAEPAAETIANAELRAAVERAMRRDEMLSMSEIARRADPPFCNGSQVARLLGRIRTAPRRRGDRFYPPRFRTDISIADAVRIARAAGVDPVDVEGL